MIGSLRFQRDQLPNRSGNQKRSKSRGWRRLESLEPEHFRQLDLS